MRRILNTSTLFAIAASLALLAGCASQAELNARTNFLAAAEQSSAAAKSGDKKALADACEYYQKAASLAIKIADAEAALNACEVSGNAGNAYSSYLMGFMLETTQGFYRSTDYYARRYSTHLERNVATAKWYRKAERDGFKPAAKHAMEMEEWIAKSSKKGGSDVVGKLAAGAFVAGLANSANISNEAKAKVITSVASDLASNGKGTATARLLNEQTTRPSSNNTGSTANKAQAARSATNTSAPVKPEMKKNSSQAGIIARKTSDIDVGNGKTIAVTTTLLPGDGIGNICGEVLHLGGMGGKNTRIFNCDGTGSYVNDCEPGQNTGTFQWGFALSKSDKSKLNIRTFSEWGWGPNTSNKAAEIVMRFKGGCQDNEVIGGIIGVNEGKIIQGMGYGYASE